MVQSFQHIGKRNRQEDSFYIDQTKGLYIVCDGIGGYEKGDLTSKLVISFIVQYLNNISIKPICINCIINAIKYAQTQLNKTNQKEITLTKSGTTIALLLYQNNSAITAHLGDSRIMFLKNKSANYWTTKDHSLVQELFDANILRTEDEMLKHPMKNKITNAIYTGQDANLVQVTTHELYNIGSKDKFILFTDGILEAITVNDLISIIMNNSLEYSIQSIADKVIKDAVDNSTIVLLEI